MKTPEEMAQQYISTIADTHSVKAACEKAFIAGYLAAIKDEDEAYQKALKKVQEATKRERARILSIVKSEE
jgi:hypothetical protein